MTSICDININCFVIYYKSIVKKMQASVNKKINANIKPERQGKSLKSKVRAEKADVNSQTV